jgi:hypothetical protein
MRPIYMVNSHRSKWNTQLDTQTFTRQRQSPTHVKNRGIKNAFASGADATVVFSGVIGKRSRCRACHGYHGDFVRFTSPIQSALAVFPLFRTFELRTGRYRVTSLYWSPKSSNCHPDLLAFVPYRLWYLFTGNTGLGVSSPGEFPAFPGPQNHKIT